MKFFCGASREIITPPIGTLLYGYRPDVISASVHDDLTVTAAAFGNGTDTALLISAALGDIQTELDIELRTKIAEVCALPMRNIILAATHTHCAPNTSGVDGWGDIDRAFVNGILLPALLKASKTAVDSMEEAEIGSAVCRSDIGINRRQQQRGGGVTLGQNPWGCYDPNLTALVIREAQSKKTILNILHYGCHGTACGCATEITRDWSGVMIDKVEEQTGALTVFINGAIGDVGPRLSNGKTVGDITYVEQLGSLAARDAINLLETVRSFTAPEVTLHFGSVRLPYQAHPPLEEVQAQLSEIRNPETLINCERLHYSHLKDVESLLASGEASPPSDFSFEQTILCIGDTVFIPFPFEIFSEISMRLRAYSGYQNTLCLSCANGYNAYLPTQDQLCRGGYEVEVFRFASVYSLADNTDENIINENLRILEE